MKRITQETFDETVQENIDEFDMSRREATEEALKQFKSQGVDLSNICVSYDEGDEEWLNQARASIQVLSDAVGDGKGELKYEKEPCVAALRSLATLCTDANAERAANAKKLLASKPAANVITRFCAVDDKDVVLAALDALRALCDSHEGNRDSFWPMSMSTLCKMATARQDDPEILKKVMTTVRVLCTKTENNKVNFVAQGGLDLLVNTLKSCSDNPALALEACLATKAVIAVDDLRKDFSSAHNNTRQLMNKGAVSILLGIARAYRTDAEIMAAALAAVRNLALNEESVGQIAGQGGLELVMTGLEAHPDQAALCRTAIAVMRNVSADDKWKTTLCDNGGAELMLKAMRRHSQDAKLVEHGVATIAAMSLRSPDNALKLVALGAGLQLVTAMRQHKGVQSVQRQGCLAIRNLVSRNNELVESFLELGAEPLLRHAGTFQESVDEAYAALRDLGCEVRRVVIDPTTGRASDAVETFGKVKSTFRPVFEASSDIDAAVDKAITEPSQAYRF